MRRLVGGALGVFAFVGLILPVMAQELDMPLPEPVPAGEAAPDPDLSEPIPFEGGAFTITPTPDFDKLLAYDGQELARNFVVHFDRTVALGDTNVALFDVGDGGNQCGPTTVLAWKPKGEDIRTVTIGEECGAPPAAATSDSLYFVPYLIPGASAPVQVWSPDRGLRVSGIMNFTPQPGSNWNDLETAELVSMVDAFDNEAVYRAASRMLGEGLIDFASGLLTGGGAERTVNGVFFGHGCVPHACGSADSFMAVDPQARKIYMAQAGEQPEPKTWPALKTWPADMRSAMRAALSPPQ